MKDKIRLLAALALLAVIVACAVLLGAKALSGARGADLTADRLYSLSAGSRHILAGLNRPVTLRLYYSREVAKEGPEGVRFWNDYFFYVRDLLQEYVAQAGGNLKLEVIDPKPYSDEEEAALQAGLQSYGMRGESFLFGLTAETELGKVSAIPFFEPRRQLFVEYDVSKLIADLTRRAKSQIGVVSSLPVMGDDYPEHLMRMLAMQGRRVQPPWLVFQELRQSYEVETAKAEHGRFAKKYDFLLVVHPKKLDPATLFAIDQYVMDGGRLVVFVDPFSVMDQPQQQRSMFMAPPDPAQSASGLNELLEKWGARMEPGLVAVSPSIGVQLQTRRNRPPELFLPFLDLNGGCVNREISATAGLKDVRMVIAGALETHPGEGVTAETLLHTAADGNVWKPGPGELYDPPAAPAILKSLDQAKQGVRPLAVLLRGKFASNYPEGVEIEEKVAPDPAAAPEAGKDGAAPKEQTRKVKLAGRATAEPGAAVLVVGDVDMLADQVAYQENPFGAARQGDAAAFVENALEFLGGDDALISIRTRGAYLRPLTVVQDIEKKAEAETAEKVSALNATITAKQQELQATAAKTGKGDVKLLQKEIIEKRREVEAQIRRCTKELRQLQQARRDKVKGLETKVALVNLLAAPGLVLLLGAGVWLFRRRG